MSAPDAPSTSMTPGGPGSRGLALGRIGAVLNILGSVFALIILIEGPPGDDSRRSPLLIAVTVAIVGGLLQVAGITRSRRPGPPAP